MTTEPDPSTLPHRDSEPSSETNAQGRVYRLVALQPTAFSSSVSQPVALSSERLPTIAFRPRYQDEAQQMLHGGTELVVEFCMQDDACMIS